MLTQTELHLLEITRLVDNITLPLLHQLQPQLLCLLHTDWEILYALEDLGCYLYAWHSG